MWWTNNAGQTWHLVFEHQARAGVTGLAFAYTGTGVSYVTFDSPDPKARDVYRIERQPGNVLGWTVSRITANLPIGNRELNTVVASPKNANEVFVGTDAGVYRGTLGLFGLWNWQPWNDGLPLAMVTDLEFEWTTGEVRAATFGRGAWRIKVAQ